MLEKIIELDKSLFIFLNGLGSVPFDPFWEFITKQARWTPFFLTILYFANKKISRKKELLYILLSVGLIVLVTDQFTNLVKFYFQRLRPCSEPELAGMIRIVKSSDTFSFFSGHASNSMATMTFIFLLIRKYYKFAFLVFLFPLIFAYSRIYLGLHYPSDILTGYTVGLIFGILFYKLYLKVVKDSEFCTNNIYR